MKKVRNSAGACLAVVAIVLLSLVAAPSVFAASQENAMIANVDDEAVSLFPDGKKKTKPRTKGPFPPKKRGSGR